MSLAASSAFAGPVVMSGSYASGTYTVTDSTTNLSSLDHHSLYTWQIEGLQGLTSGQVVTAASLTFNNFSNWTSVGQDLYNILWMHLLDSAAHVSVGTGIYADDPERVSSFTDVSNGGTVLLGDVRDNFLENSTHATAGWLVPTNGVCTAANTGTNAGTSPLNVCTDGGDTYLANTTNAADAGVLNYHASGLPGPFGTSETTWTYNFSSAQLGALRGYINNGNDIAIGLDSDCHFFDRSVVMAYSVGPAVPEPATLMLVGSGILGLVRRRRV